MKFSYGLGSRRLNSSDPTFLGYLLIASSGASPLRTPPTMPKRTDRVLKFPFDLIPGIDYAA